MNRTVGGAVLAAPRLQFDGVLHIAQFRSAGFVVRRIFRR